MQILQIQLKERSNLNEKRLHSADSTPNRISSVFQEDKAMAESGVPAAFRHLSADSSWL
jgi:hypothetical protein